jgi:7-keto-8-aminopelargonate synthetase-like enzyme
VEPGTSRLRLVASAAHSEPEIEGVAAAIRSLLEV